MSEPSDYPGAAASVEQLHHLADCYAEAAHRLMDMSRKGDHLSRAPFRLNAIHAIELYLSAFLQRTGSKTCEVRAMQHDLASRWALAKENGLQLRQRTVAHLLALSEEREYVVVRYGPEILSDSTHPSRLTATLTEVGKKVAARIQANDTTSV